MRTERYESTSELTTGLRSVLADIRSRRGFNVSRCIQAKSILINRYFEQHGLSSAVIGVSGGIDSAVALALLKHAASQNGSAIKRISPLLLPLSIDQGVSNQEFATCRGTEVIKSCGLTPVTIDLAAGFNGVRTAFNKGGQEAGDAWADGQLAAYLRTPALYYATALNTQQGFPGIVCGTTNRDEGAYLGFFGKASDGMVDLQIISDLHKSEIYALAQALNTPAITVHTPPTGDVFDGKTHLDMIGAPYDFVELYLSVLEQGDAPIRELNQESKEQFAALAERIETMHRYNRHKYMGGNPSIHLDVYPRCVPGGWEAPRTARDGSSEKSRNLVAEFSLDPQVLNRFRSSRSVERTASPIADCGESGAQISKVFSADECALLIETLDRTSQVPVGMNGILRDFNPEDSIVGSYRATLYSEELAALIWERIQSSIPAVRCFDEFSFTDSADHPVWRAIGVNPSLRFIKYLKGGALIPHYDAGYDYADGSRHTLMSLVIYLTEGINGCGGRTRFILDRQRNLPARERDYSDWNRAADDQEVLFSIQPQAGSALVFDHRLLHDAESWEGEQARIIIRTDIIFERCGNSYAEPAPISQLQFKDQVSSGAHVLKKALQDPFFRYACAKHSYGEIIEAGFFDDGAPSPLIPESARELLCTPLHKVSRNFSIWNSGNRLRAPVVLLSTGGFCPIHKGHLAMMQSARSKLESEGYAVIGGFISPDHDDYVTKKCGLDAIPASERLYYVDMATEESDWLSTDPWAALYAERALNFTDIIRRLEAYLANYLRGFSPVKVVYVCGGDNALFARAFTGRGSCVVVHRPGESTMIERLQQELGTTPSARVWFAEAQLAHPAASRLIRSGKIDYLPEKLQQAWKQRQIPPEGPIRIYLRDEGSWSTTPWHVNRPALEVERARKEFLTGVRLAFIKAFNNSAIRRDFAFRTISATQQQIKLKEYMKRRQFTLVSLDAVIPGEKNILISRCFELCDSKRRGDFTTRPGSPDLNSQLAELGSGRFVFYDDDIATGQTIRALLEHLPPRCKVEEILSLFSLVTNDELDTVEMSGESSITDIGDLRDFLVGSRDGGLMVSLPDGTLARAPYMLPYVRNTRRMSIPVDEELEFSRQIWKLNAEFFSQMSKPITISECSTEFQRLAYFLGWKKDGSMQDFALCHIEMLDRQKNGTSRMIDETGDEERVSFSKMLKVKPAGAAAEAPEPTPIYGN